MSIRKASSLRTSHHAYLVLDGARENATFTFPILGINEARLIRERASLASESEEIKIYCEVITEEGQNALLKTLEEPARGLTFIILAPRSIQLLPTLLSRLEILEIVDENKTKNSGEDSDEADKFVRASFDSRLKIIADLIKKAEKLGENPKSAALKFLDSLEKYLAQNYPAEKIKPDFILALAEIRQGRVYLNDKSGTAKLILEHIAIVLPSATLFGK